MGENTPPLTREYELSTGQLNEKDKQCEASTFYEI